VSSDGRFAPSPTGALHLGSLRTALAAWLFARSAGGRFLLRIEDLDRERSRESWVDSQLADLRALGLDWDGPVLRQSERLARYQEALAELERAGMLYPCFCTRAEIREAASAPHGELPEGAYPGTCRRLSAAERAARLAAGDRHALRFDAGRARVSFVDRLAGRQSFDVDDFVVRRADGVFAYQLAVVVDDAAQGVGEVVRGADLLDSTARQIVLQRALGLPSVTYAHVGLVLGPDGRRLAKRFGGAGGEVSTGTLRALACSLGIAAAVVERAERAADLLAGFDRSSLPRGPVSF
jgi:glutamyl-tRNA synthetase